jgi:hypothetical protein
MTNPNSNFPLASSSGNNVTAAAQPPLLPAAVVTINSSSCGDTDENLQGVQSVSSSGSISCRGEGSGRSSGSLQDLHEREEARETYARQREGVYSSGERSCSKAGSACRSIREAVKTTALSALRDRDAGASDGWTPQGLLKANGSNLALPSVPRDRASNLEAGRVAEGSQACGSDGPGRASAVCDTGIAGPQDSIPDPSHPPASVHSALLPDTGVAPLSLPVDPGLEAAIAGLESGWRAQGVALADPLGIPAFLKRSSDNVAPFARTQI